MATQASFKGPVNTVFAAAAIGVGVSLAIVAVALFTRGHAAFNTTSQGPLSWGLPIVTYDYFLLASTGLAFVASLALAFGVRDFYPIARRCVWLALATAAAAVVALTLELGHPLRAFWAIPLSFQYLSPLFWKPFFIAAYGVLLLVVFNRMTRPGWDYAANRGLGVALFVAAVAVALNAGAVFGMMAMRPFWYGPLIPVYFLAESFLSGVAFAMLVTYLAYGLDPKAMPDKARALLTGAMPGIFAAALAVVIAMVGSRAVTGLWSNAEGLQAFDWMVGSPLFHLELWVGLVLPLVLMLRPGSRNQPSMQLAAAVLVLVALFIGRYEFVIGGQVVPLFKGSWVPGFVRYTPSLTEWMLLLLALSVAFAVYAFGEKRFDLSATPGEKR
ncbi:MAG: hypothetical protein A2151_06410 [Candidatus Muproteobacteria bacterium RBG_16_65_34]|uniref:Polysulfide reductase n=1 Tax=Candidatus Muproteobacteria bacterium RBG_16_65_34 TaxID=1817760 RepID=A0A1F6TQW9_9PROT|nr:MAG: hypothetical protein A2151_06410 [Candidatus Muproteobacteria bacterium RBG_16_65_34]